MFSAPMRPIASVNRKLQTGHPSTVFSVVSYNVLAQDLLHKNQYLYTRCPPELLTWEYRKWNILNELVESTADVSVLCLYLLLWLLTAREGFSTMWLLCNRVHYISGNLYPMGMKYRYNFITQKYIYLMCILNCSALQ